MLSIYVIGKSISKVKNCRYGTKSRKVFELHWKYYIDERRQALNCKEKQKYLIRIYIEEPDLFERASFFETVIKKTFFLMMRIHTYYFQFLLGRKHAYTSIICGRLGVIRRDENLFYFVKICFKHGEKFILP